MDKDYNAIATKTSVGLAGVAYALAGLPWAELAAFATFVFMALQAFFLLRDKWWRDRQKRRAEELAAMDKRLEGKIWGE